MDFYKVSFVDSESDVVVECLECEYKFNNVTWYIANFEGSYIVSDTSYNASEGEQLKAWASGTFNTLDDVLQFIHEL